MRAQLTLYREAAAAGDFYALLGLYWWLRFGGDLGRDGGRVASFSLLTSIHRLSPIRD
jgi:hypothetical protein